MSEPLPSCDPEVMLAELDDAREYTPSDPWERRRKEAWGASEMPMVLVLTGRHDASDLPKYMQEKLQPVQRPLSARGLPHLIAEKAGLIKSSKAGPAAAIGTARERELLERWTTLLVCGEYALPEETLIDVGSIRHASAAPKEWYPLRARRGRLAVTPDAWCRWVSGELFDVECKCTVSDITDCRWTWRVQVQSQGIATSSAGAFVLGGSRWARRERDDGPVLRAFVEPDEGLRQQIIQASDEAWELVQNARKRRADNEDGSQRAAE